MKLPLFSSRRLRPVFASLLLASVCTSKRSFAEEKAPAPAPAFDDRNYEPQPFVVAAAEPDTDAAPVKPREEAPLDPFPGSIMTAEVDSDYVAASTLAGSRLRTPIDHPRMEVVFVLDTTGSMSAMIEAAKRKIWAVASRLKSAEPTPEIRFGLVAYRDRGDEYVTKVSALTPDIDAIYADLMKLRADGGGDGPESVNEALAVALKSAGWTEDRTVFRTIFLVGDAPPHYYADDVPWETLARSAAERGIIINGLQCGNDPETAKAWQGIARLAGGANAQILDENRAVAFEYRFDADIIGMNRALNGTIVPYGTAELRAAAVQAKAMLGAMTAEGVADRATFLGKSEYGALTTGRGDLVADLIAGRADLEKIDASQLEPEWAGKKAPARTAELKRLVERRRTLLKEIAVLLKERESLLAAKLAGAKSEQDLLVLSPFVIVESQAAKKGFHFE